ncbi:SDR family NAD(P)-dependent oxidoreductase [bacterium]|nr:SDR family NAD(P)-dependent oxidoreductase [bacterium]
MTEAQPLAGRTAIVTGGGTGIGAAIARILAEAGARVAISGRREDPLRDVSASVSEAATPILFRTCDVADRDSVASFFAWARGELGAIDILVNSAGINIPNRSAATLAPEDWDRVLQVNATGAFNCIHQVLPEMRQRHDGLIINVCSVAGLRTAPLGGVAYNASKFAMAALGRSIGEEERDNGIRVTTIYPGEVETPILDARPVPVSDEHRARILQPDDLAASVLMVACLPPRARVPELVMIPTSQSFT